MHRLPPEGKRLPASRLCRAATVYHSATPAGYFIQPRMEILKRTNGSQRHGLISCLPRAFAIGIQSLSLFAASVLTLPLSAAISISPNRAQFLSSQSRSGSETAFASSMDACLHWSEALSPRLSIAFFTVIKVCCSEMKNLFILHRMSLLLQRGTVNIIRSLACRLGLIDARTQPVWSK